MCAYCCTPQPLSALAAVATWLECIDRDACDQRAASSGIYAHTESEQLIAQHEAAQGAPR